MIFFGDVSPAIEVALIGVGIAAIVNPTVALGLQVRQFRDERAIRAEERAHDLKAREDERAHDRERWQAEKDAQRKLAMLGRRIEAVDEFRGQLATVLRTTNSFQRPFRYGRVVGADHDGPGERRAATETISDAVEAARAASGRVRLFYGSQSTVASASVDSINAALAAQAALHRVFVLVADVEDPWPGSESWTDAQRIAARDGQQDRLNELDKKFDVTVRALSETIAALVDAARDDDDGVA